jgi:hypothetical protein
MRPAPLSWFLGRQGERRAAAAKARRAMALHVAAGDRAGQGLSLNSLGWQHAHLGDLDLAAEYCARAVQLLDEVGDRRGTGHQSRAVAHACRQRRWP